MSEVLSTRGRSSRASVVPAAPRPVVIGDDGIARCDWAANDAEYRQYHDEEWGRPLHGDRVLFEKMSLEGFQAGLSWITILRRRPTFRVAFEQFELAAVASFGMDDVDRLMLDTGIIRNRAKIEATISNAGIALAMTAASPGALDELLWSFAPTPPHPRPRTHVDIVAATAESTAMSKRLKSLGFRFVGPTTMHALMQSSGMIDDHFDGCWRASPAS